MFYKDKLVLVTGGSGFVGGHIVRSLLGQGARVRVPVHHRPLMIQHDAIEEVTADLMHQSDCLKVTEGVDYVFHAAGAVAGVAVNAGNPMAGMTINLNLTAQILQAAWTQQVKRILIFSSSTGYPALERAVKEEDMWSGPTHPSYFGYGWMRRYFERLGEFVTSKSNTEVVLVRPTAVYGSHDNFDPVTSHVIPALIRKAVERMNPFEVWGTGDEVRDFLHIKDLARGCLLMLEKNPQEPVNIGYGKEMTIKDVVQAILKATNYEDVKVVFNSDRPTAIPIRMVDTNKARQLLGFEPQISLEEGIKDTVEWYLQQQNIS